MLKSMKYEFLKNRVSLAVMGIIFACLEATFLIGCALKKDEPAAIAVTGLIVLSVVCVFYIYITGITAYSRDLREKSGYLVFMTPLSTYKVIGAKLLMVLIEATVFAAWFVLFIILDVTLLLHRFADMTWQELAEGLGEIFFFLRDPEVLRGITGAMCAGLILAFISLFMTVTLAYLAISLSATVLQNRRGKGIVALIFFLVLNQLANLAANHLPVLDIDWNNAMGAVVARMPAMLFYVALSVGAFIGTGLLLEKKISL